eukprot:gene1501-1523_t
MPFLARSTALLAAMLLLSGCSYLRSIGEDKLPPICPSLALLPDASDVTRYRGAGRDLTEIVLDARITAIPATCVRDAKNVVKTTMQVRSSVTRGPAATTRQGAVTYVISVLDGDRILDQQDYTVQANFPSNVDRLDLVSDKIDLRFPVSAEKQASSYKVLVGLRLTQQELEENRKRGPR